MSTSSPGRWTVQGTTFAVWALATASAVYWGLKLSAAAPSFAAPSLPARAPLAADPAAVARLLGSSPVAVATAAAAPQAPALASRLALVGVVAGRSRSGVALISVDGRPARPFRVGATVVDNVMLQSVEGRRAMLGGAGQAALTLELPARSAANSNPAPVPGAPPGGVAPGMGSGPFPPAAIVIPPPSPVPVPGQGPVPGFAPNPGAGIVPGMMPSRTVPGAVPGAVPGTGVQPGPVPMAAPR